MGWLIHSSGFSCQRSPRCTRGRETLLPTLPHLSLLGPSELFLRVYSRGGLLPAATRARPCTDDRSAVERRRYHQVIADYRRAARLFPMVLVRSLLGFDA